MSLKTIKADMFGGEKEMARIELHHQLSIPALQRHGTPSQTPLRIVHHLRIHELET